MTMCRFANVETVLFPAFFGFRADDIDDLFMNSTVIFDSFNTVSSSSNLPKRQLSPDFSLTTLNPLDAYSTNSRETSICFGDDSPALLPTLIKSASGLSCFPLSVSYTHLRAHET